MASFEEELDANANDATARILSRYEERIAARDNKIKVLEKSVRSLTEERDEILLLQEEFYTPAGSISVQQPKWAKPTTKVKKHAATAFVMLSDLHLDEIVKPEEVNGMNAYSREIALGRLQRIAEGAIRLGTELMGGFKYDGAIVCLGGDLFSGSLHDLAEFNESHSVIASLDFWVDHLAAFLDTIATAYGPTHVVSVVGNHGRNTRKPRTKGRVEDNFDWLMARNLQRHFREDKRFTWNIPLSADAYVDVYNTKLLLTHGDQAKGGSGISGLLTPVSLLDHRKRKRNASFGMAHDHMFMGHFHQYIRGLSFTVGGSPKGLDEYAYLGNFGYELPSSPFAVITPEHGVTIEAAIYCQDRKAEGW